MLSQSLYVTFLIIISLSESERDLFIEKGVSNKLEKLRFFILNFENNKEEMLLTKKIILNLIENYSLRDIYLNPPEVFGYLKTDFVQELESLNPDDYNNTFSFYFKIRNIFKKARDIHFKFTPPCLSGLHAVLPFDFVIENFNGNDSLKITKSSLTNVTDYFLNNMGGKNVLGKRIIKITTHDIEEYEKENPVVTINRWSYFNEPFLKNELGRFSSTLSDLFSARPLSSYDIPKHNVSIKYINEFAQEEELELPFLLYSENNNSFILSLCPPISKDDEHFIHYLNIYKHYKSIFEQKMQRVHERYKRAHNLELSNTLNASIISKLNINLKKLEHNLHFNKSHDDVNVEESVKYKIYSYLNLIKGIVQKEKRLIIIVIRSFAVDDYNDKFNFCNVLIRTIRLGVESSCYKILFNVINNGGGSIDLYKFIEDLLWSKRNPLDFTEVIPATPFNDMITKEPQLQETQRIYTDKKIVIRIFDHETHLEDFKEADKIIPSERRRKFTKEFITTAKGLFTVLMKYFKEDISVIQSCRFSPENVLVLTDGHCSSSCASFVKYIRLMELGSVVTIGKDLFHPNIDDISEGVEGFVQTISNPTPNENKVKPYFFYRSGTRVSLSVPMKYSLKEDEKEIMDFVKVPPDYRINKFVDYKKMDDNEYLISLGDDCLPFFESCRHGIIQKDYISCPPNLTEKKMHLIKGHPCITKKDERVGRFFNKTHCSIAGCEDGFYYKKNRCFRFLEWGEESFKQEEISNKHIEVDYSSNHIKNKEKKKQRDEL